MTSALDEFEENWEILIADDLGYSKVNEESCISFARHFPTKNVTFKKMVNGGYEILMCDEDRSRHSVMNMFSTPHELMAYVNGYNEAMIHAEMVSMFE